MDDLQKALLEAAARRKAAGVLTIPEAQNAHLEAAKARRAEAKQRREEALNRSDAEAEKRNALLRETIERQGREFREKRAALIARLEEAASKRAGLLQRPTPEAEAAKQMLDGIRGAEAAAEITRIERSALSDALGGKS
jgi:sugar phosphate isomerase/epimerase